MSIPPATMPQPHPASTPEPMTPARATRPARFGFFFGIAATVLTLGAIVLAVFAPQLTSAPSLHVPQGWQQVYDANPGDTTSQWSNTSGCNFASQGLDIASDSTCEFQPAGGVPLSGGVLVVAQLAPAADISLAQDAGILLDKSLLIIITQQGDYQICEDQCVVFSSSGNGRIIASGSTIAWHADAFIPNEIALLYNADQNTAAFYVNGQFVDQLSVGIGSSPTVALTTSSNGEALFTHVAIYAGSAS